MNRTDSTWRKLKHIVYTTAVWWTLPCVVWAQESGAAQPSQGGSKGYVLPYFLVLMGIALGMLVVCNRSKRGERAKPEQYGE